MHSTTLTLGWAVWQPFDPSQNIEDEPQPTQMSLELKSGPGFKPTIIPNSAHNACYQVLMTIQNTDLAVIDTVDWDIFTGKIFCL